MKKKITHPDGTIEEYEGTAEELAEIERKITSGRKNENVKPGPRLLLDSADVIEFDDEDVIYR